jgi:glutamate/aspartate transport system substrate-binding protein
MKKTLALALVLGLALVSPTLGQEARLTLDKIKATGTILIGYRETSIPFSFVDKDRKPTGYSVELCERIAGTAVVGTLASTRFQISGPD